MLLAPAASVLTAYAAKADEVGANIVGGNNATQQYGAISLWVDGRNRCAASLINQYWAITAAHCQNRLIPGVTEVRTSSLNNSVDYENVGLRAAYIHPDFDPAFLTNDIALIRFERPVQHTQPLHLTKRDPAVGTIAKTAGWGWICEDLSNPDCGHSINILQELTVKIAPNSKCPAMWDPTNELCVISSNESHAMACFGDSGGPLVVKSLNRWDLVGMTLYDGDDWETSSGCTTNPDGTTGTGVYLKTAKYVDWILQTIIHNSDPAAPHTL